MLLWLNLFLKKIKVDFPDVQMFAISHDSRGSNLLITMPLANLSKRIPRSSIEEESNMKSAEPTSHNIRSLHTPPPHLFLCMSPGCPAFYENQSGKAC